ncbi:hypothetical protein V7S43_004783 [Phytophthora oleae]|uniref:PiggyBac transposable element-derived protein domain-containing protein n=1 Tax=Phytophthora oleae TaxID=2107226 RepID=A0ABD3FXV0_9STRA
MLFGIASVSFDRKKEAPPLSQAALVFNAAPLTHAQRTHITVGATALRGLQHKDKACRSFAMPGKRKSFSEVTKIHLSPDDYRVLVDWIEIDANFKTIYGTDGKMKIGGPPKQTKAAAFGDMADYLFAITSHRELPRLTGEQLQSRWRTSRQNLQ